MKRAVMTALAVTLLSGTSALAQGGPLSRAMRENQNQNQSQSQSQSSSQRAAPPQRESRPQQQPPQQQAAAPQAQSQSQSRGDGGRRGGDGGRQGGSGQSPLAAAAQQAQQQQGQRQQSGWQGQRRPDGQGAATQGRPGSQANSGRYNGGQDRGQGERGGDRQQGQGRPDGQYDRDRRADEGPLARAARENARRQGNDNGRPGWNNNDRGDYSRRPVIRPEDRRDRDRNRPRYDQRRYPHYVTPYQRYRWIGPSYRLPPSFYSFRWQFGQTLPWDWYTPNYYLNDYYAYGLPMPPIGCEWVRVGDDAILVDVFTGRVYQVVYNLFW